MSEVIVAQPTSERLPGLVLRIFETRLGDAMATLARPGWLEPLQSLDAEVPLTPDPELSTTVRKMLRAGGFRPSGRNKPASEYLAKVAGDGRFPAINTPIDIANIVSLQSRLPISVVDADRLEGALRIAVAEDTDAGPVEYVFNPSGQTLAVDGLVCLQDERGPCANAVKDAQRTKTHDETRRTLSIIWGAGAEDHVDATARWYRELLARAEVGTTAPWRLSRG